MNKKYLFKHTHLISPQHIRIITNHSLFNHTYYFASAPSKAHTEQELNKDVSPQVLRRRLIFRWFVQFKTRINHHLSLIILEYILNN